LQHHPDLCAQHQRPAAEKYFKEITAAYTKLAKDYNTRRATSSGPTASTSYHYSTAGYARTAAAHPKRYSNGVVGAVIAAPLAMLGIWLSYKSSYNDIGGGIDPTSLQRIHGWWHPPENPFARDDLRPKTHSHFNKSNNSWGRRVLQHWGNTGVGGDGVTKQGGGHAEPVT
jgi:hypothetical protein